MSYKIKDIEGVGPAYGDKLEEIGVHSVADLLERCCDLRGRRGVSAETGITEKLLLRWVNHADLMRVKGIGPQYAELLEASGVDTVKELATRNAVNLAASLTDTNAAKSLANVNPSEAVVAAWVAQARALNPAVSH